MTQQQAIPRIACVIMEGTGEHTGDEQQQVLHSQNSTVGVKEIQGKQQLYTFLEQASDVRARKGDTVRICTSTIRP